jgi:hypothetical protein
MKKNRISMVPTTASYSCRRWMDQGFRILNFQKARETITTEKESRKIKLGAIFSFFLVALCIGRERTSRPWRVTQPPNASAGWGDFIYHDVPSRHTHTPARNYSTIRRSACAGLGALSVVGLTWIHSSSFYDQNNRLALPSNTGTVPAAEYECQYELYC